MKRIYSLKMILLGCCLLGAGLIGQAWAEVPCNSSTDGNAVTIGVSGGSPSCDSWGMPMGCSLSNPGESCSALDENGDVIFTVTTEQVGQELQWSMVYGPTYDKRIGEIDVSIWEGAKKGQNYPFVFGYDVGLAPDYVAMSCNNGASSGFHFCMDGIAEPELVLENTGQPTVGFTCDQIIDPNDPGAIETTAEIYGVELDVGGVVAGQGLTTIVVARSNRPCAVSDGDVTSELPRCTDLTNATGWEIDPAFGFVQQGQISLRNICIAQAGQFITEEQCDPDKEVVNGPFIDSLRECDPRYQSIIREEVNVGFEGSGYVGYSGSKRYY